MSNTQLMDLFLAAQRRLGRTELTIRADHQTLQDFTGFLASEAPHLWLGNATVDEVRAWIDAKSLAPASTAAYLSRLRSFYQWAQDENYVRVNPVIHERGPKLPKYLPHPTLDANLALALRETSGMDHVIICLAAFAGMRRQEIAGLRWQDTRDGMLRVTSPKGGHERLIPMHPEIKAALNKLHRLAEGPVLTTRRGGRVSPDWVSRRMEVIGAKLGVPLKSHDLRHFFGVRLYQNTRDIRLVGDMLGHASINTTSIYTAFDPSHATEAIASVHANA